MTPLKDIFKSAGRDDISKIKGFSNSLISFFTKPRYLSKEFAAHKIIPFPKNKRPFSSTPALAARGIIALALAVCLLFVFGTVFFPHPQPSQNSLIQTASVYPAGPIIAGQSVKWVAVVSKADITSNQYFLKLPKSASNIKVKTLSSTNTDAYLATIQDNSKTPPTDNARQQLANIFPKGKNPLFADLKQIAGDAAGAVADTVSDLASQITGQVQITDDAKVVDLSAQSTEKEQAKEQKQQQKEDKKEQKDKKDQTPEASVTPAGTAEPSSTPEPSATPSEELSPTPSSTPEPSATPVEELTPSPSPESTPALEEQSPTPSPTPAEEDTSDKVLVEYETAAPEITEQNTKEGKLVTVSGPEQPPLTDVIAFTAIPEIYKVGQEDKIKIKWQNNGGQNVIFTARDLNNNGKIDYVEWTVPHLSEQTFEIIFISKAFELDENQEIVNDIYGLTQAQDNQWAAVPNGHYVRVTFSQTLSSVNDNTIYAKPTSQDQPATIEVYPVYADSNGNQTEGPLVATFETINREETYKILLTGLQTPTDVFDLKITNADVDIDYIVDPAETWRDSNYAYRKQITIQNTYVDADLTNFPALIYINADADIGGHVLSNLNDIRFYDNAGTLLKYEVENFSISSGHLTASIWVKVPSIKQTPSGTDNQIWLYYGYASATDGQDAANVYDSNYVSVWHLNESGSGAAGEFVDKKSAHDGQGGEGTSGKVPTQVSGILNTKAQSFDGTDDYINIANSSDYNLFSSSGTFTISCWIKDNTTVDKGTIIGMYNGAGTPRWGLRARDSVAPSGKTGGVFYESAGSAKRFAGSTTIGTSTFQYLVATGTAGSTGIMYYNGAADTTASDTMDATFNSTYKLTIGSSESGAAPVLKGTVQEIRISRTARAASWIKFEYNNATQGDNELSWEAQETGMVAVPAISSAANQKFAKNDSTTTISTITITDDAVTSTITAANDIRIKIPATFNMAWDETDTTATIGGTDSDHIASSTVTYEDTNKTAVIDVGTNFEAGDTITVSGLSFANFSAASAVDNLELEVTNGGSSQATDDKTIAIGAPTISSYENQTFLKNDGLTSVSPITITDDASTPVINTTNDIRIKIPASFNMKWNATDTSSIIDGTASGHVSATVSYEDDDKTLLIDVTENFAAGDAITIDGLSFKSFSNTSSADNLELEVNNAGTSSALDDKTKIIENPVITAAMGASQPAAVSAGSSDNVLAVASIVRNSGVGSITAVTIKENGGTVDAQNNLSNIQLWLSSNTTIDGGDTQIGDTGSFDGANGEVTFTGSIDVPEGAPEYLIVVGDIGSSAGNGETIEMQFKTLASTDDISGTPLDITGTTVINSMNAWLYREKITFHNSAQDENLTDFPVMIKLSHSTFDFSKAQTNGEDLRFTDSDGATALSYEIEYYDRATETAIIWVKVPQINASSNTDFIYLYFGNADAADGQNITDVWSNGFAAVYHFAQQTGQYLDSTGNNNDTTLVDIDYSADSSRSVTDANGLGYYPRMTSNGGENIPSTAGDRIGIPDSNSLDFGTSAFTIFVRMKSSVINYDCDITRKGSTGVVENSWWKIEWGDQSVNNRVAFLINVSGDNHVLDYDTLASDGTWNNVWGIRSIADSNIKLYLNGSLALSGAGNNGSVSNSAGVGIGNKDTLNDDYCNANLDEVRYISAERSADWIAAENLSFNNTLCAYDYSVPLSDNTAPTLTSVSDAPDPVKGGSTITITPGGQGDADTDDLYFVCNESGSPTLGTTLCSQTDTPYSNPYSSMTCTYNVSSGDTTRTVYCRTYDGTDYSVQRTTTYAVDSTAPTVVFYDDVAAGPGTSDAITGSWGDASVKKWEYDTDGVCSATADDYLKTNANSMNQSVQTNNGKYICLYGEDAVGNKATRASANDINIDITAPVTAADGNGYTFGVPGNAPVTVTLTCADGGGSGCLATYYCTDTDGTCTPATLYNINGVVISTEGSSFIRYRSLDLLNNTETIKTQALLLSFVPPEITPTPTPTPTPHPEGGGGGVVGFIINIDVVDVVDQFSEKLDVFNEKVKNVVDILNPPEPQPSIIYPPISESVPLETPEAFKNKLKITQPTTGDYSMEFLPQSIKNLANKFPEFKATLQKVGISKPSDIDQLKSVKFTLPGLSEKAGLSANEPDITKLTAEEKEKIPTEIIFARVGADKIDLNTNISISDTGEPVQTLNAIEGKRLNLVVKVDEAVINITGYVVLKPKPVDNASAFNRFSSPLLSALFSAFNSSSTDENMGNEVILQQFQYSGSENNDGIYTADITAPTEKGQYEIKTVINYANSASQSKQIRLDFVVDPQGYVYEKFGEKESRVENATVSIYWLNPDTKEYELWPARDFQQKNPQITDVTGEYAFLVPPGYYYITITCPSYVDYSGKPFQVQNGVGINANVELQSNSWWKNIFNANRIMLITGGIILGLSVILITVILTVLIASYTNDRGKLKKFI